MQLLKNGTEKAFKLNLRLKRRQREDLEEAQDLQLSLVTRRRQTKRKKIRKERELMSIRMLLPTLGHSKTSRN